MKPIDLDSTRLHLNGDERHEKRRKGRAKITMRAAHRRSASQIMAGISAGFLPVASYTIAHFEAPASSGGQQAALYGLVLAALTYSAPTLAQWAHRWCHSWVKSVSFAALLEGVLVLSHTAPLNLTALGILASVNAVVAFGRAGK